MTGPGLAHFTDRLQQGWLVGSLAFAGLAAVACHGEEAFRRPDPDLNRMLEVPRYDIYEESHFFQDRMTMRRPPEGTVPFDAEVHDPQYLTGVANGYFVTTLPVRPSRALLSRGRDRFERFCGACHGKAGYGNPMVTRNMQRPPPSLHQARLRQLPPGRLFHIVTHGYGFMPSYAAKLDVVDRWAVIAYVKVLQRSQYAPLAELPADLRGRALGRLP